MSKKYKVIWSNIAEEDLKNIIEYIVDENLLNAQKIFKKLRKKFQAYISSQIVAVWPQNRRTKVSSNIAN